VARQLPSGLLPAAATGGDELEAGAERLVTGRSRGVYAIPKGLPCSGKGNAMIKKRRWLQFSLRTLLALVTAFGVWLGLHLQKAKRQAAAIAAIKASGGWCYYDFQVVNLDAGKFDMQAASWAPQWLRAQWGNDFLHDVEVVNMSFDEQPGRRQDNSKLDTDYLPFLEGLPNLRALYLHKTQVNDRGMRHIAGLRRLETLMMWDAYNVSDAGTACLASLTKLKHLHISRSLIGDGSLATFSRLPLLESMTLQYNNFSDEGLAHLQNMRQLKRLAVGVSSQPITDKGVAHLKGLTSLESLEIQRSKVTAEGLGQLAGLKNLEEIIVTEEQVDMLRLRRLLPHCAVY
jgi:hypothetical protein